MRRRHHEIINFKTEYDYETEVIKFTRISCKSSEDEVRKKHTPQYSHIRTREYYGEAKLERIVGPDGRMTRPTTTKKRYSGRKVGTVVI